MARGLYILTFGCQMNHYDSARIRGLLAPAYATVEDPADADLIVINTCSVREKPQQKVLSELGRLRPLKARHPHLKIVVTGCVAEQERAHLLALSPVLDGVLGPDHVAALPELLARLDDGERVALCGFESGGFHVLPQEAELPERAVSAFLGVQKGCDRFCTYCIVPHVRGREKSRPLDEVLAEARRLAAGGVRELTLLGQNINDYGRDLPGAPDFADLLREVSAIDGLARLRFVTSHPAGFTERHIRAMAELPKVCPYLHLPFQAGSDRILAAMKRGYTRADYLALIARLKEAVPGLALSTDLIVGFPGETEAEVEETIDLLDRVRFATIFSFVYSARPHTAAARLDDPVPQETKLAWLARVQAFQKDITRAANQALVGSEQEVLVEGAAKRGEHDWMGRTPCNKIVNFPGTPDLVGTLVRVRIRQAYQNSLRGELL